MNSRVGCASTRKRTCCAGRIAHIRLVDARENLHARKVGGDHKERRCLHAGRDRLTDIHIARDHDAVDWRLDDGVLEIDLILVERRARLRHLRLGGAQLGLRRALGDLGGIQLALWDQLAAGQLTGAAELYAGVVELHAQPFDVRVRSSEIRTRLFDLRLKQRRCRAGR